MCGPNTPHRLKLAGFMFTTIGFGIAALDCLCCAESACERTYDLSDSCNCLKYIIANGVNFFFFFVSGSEAGGLQKELEEF